jgi:hypothetical protein
MVVRAVRNHDGASCLPSIVLLTKEGPRERQFVLVLLLVLDLVHCRK